MTGSSTCVSRGTSTGSEVVPVNLQSPAPEPCQFHGVIEYDTTRQSTPYYCPPPWQDRTDADVFLLAAL